MRLLWLDQRLPRFTELYLYQFPRYAILSHTWDKVEVTYEDIIAGSSNKNYDKIYFCGKQAQKDQLPYFWIDSCCINKPDLNELSRSIVSMFRWYQRATKCYVYLTDVSAHGNWQEELRNSRWFTRGWTLQELLAPTCVEFFSKEGELLGTKRSLEQIIHEVTGVPIRALRGDSLDTFSIEEKFRWSSNRSTLYKEDKAYCLLGIFNVFMPLIYGEEDHALTRLKNAVTESSTIYRPTPQDSEIQKSFVFPKMQDRRLQIEPRHQNTCEWILDNPEFCQWSSSVHGLLWIKGKPGAGKSTTMAFLYETLMKMLVPGVRLDFFFTAKGANLQRTIEGMLRSLNNQLYVHDISTRDDIRGRYEEKTRLFGGSNWSWSELELQDMFTRNIVKVAKDQPVIIFIDALDEAGEEDACKIAEYFHRLNNQAQLKICISCRHYPIVAQSCRLEVVVEHHNQQDIVAYINDKLTVDSDMKRELALRSAGLFQWASLVVNLVQRDVNRGKSQKMISQSLDKVPSELKETYRYILKKVIDPDDCQLALQLFQWVCLAMTSPKLSQISGCIGQDMTEARIAALSGGLIDVTTGMFGNSKYLQVNHQSVKDFMLAEGLAILFAMNHRPLPRPDDLLAWSHGQIYQQCLHYLCTHIFEPAQQVDSPVRNLSSNLTKVAPGLFLEELKTGFKEYAEVYIFDHAYRATSYRSHDLAAEFQLLNRIVNIWTGTTSKYRIGHGLGKGTQLLHLLSYRGLVDLVRDLVLTGTDLEVRDHQRRTPLHYATYKGRKETSTILIQAGADINAVDFKGWTTLDWADEALRIWLFELGATSKDFLFPELHTALQHGDNTRSRLLLSKTIAVDPEWYMSRHFSLLLTSANHRGDEKAVRVLLESLDTQAVLSLYPYVVASRGKPGLQQIFLHVIMQRYSVFLFTLRDACMAHDTDVVVTLVERCSTLYLQRFYDDRLDDVYKHLSTASLDSFVQKKDVDQNRLMYTATIHGSEDVVRALARKNVDLNYLGELGTPIVVASQKGHAGVVKVLIAAGADMMGRKGVPFTNALHSATRHGQEGIAKILRDAGAAYRSGMNIV